MAAGLTLPDLFRMRNNYENSKDAARAFVAGAKEQEKNWKSTIVKNNYIRC
jgi:hypothetical protein